MLVPPPPLMTPVTPLPLPNLNVSLADPPVRFWTFEKVMPATLPALVPVMFQVSASVSGRSACWSRPGRRPRGYPRWSAR